MNSSTGEKHMIAVLVIVCTLSLATRCQKDMPCFYNITAGKGNFTTPGNSEEYPYNATCHWNITATLPNKVIALSFETLDHEERPSLSSCDFNFTFHDGCDHVSIESYCSGDLFHDVFRPNSSMNIQSTSSCISVQIIAYDKPPEGTGLIIHYKEVEPEDDIFILVEDNRIIKAINMLDVSQSEHPLNGDTTNYITAIAIDPLRRMLYIADDITKYIKRYRVTAWNKPMEFVDNIVTDKLQNVTSIVTDPIIGTVYWTDSGRNTISSSSYDGSSRKEIITTGLHNPRNIILDHLNQVLYWTCNGNSASVEKAFVNGSHRHTVLTQTRGEILIALGQHKGAKVYWVNTHGGSLGTICEECDHHDPIPSDSLENVNSLNAFDKYIYWTRSTNSMVFVTYEDVEAVSTFGYFRQPTDTLHYCAPQILANLINISHETVTSTDVMTLLTIRSLLSEDDQDIWSTNNLFYIPIVLCALCVILAAVGLIYVQYWRHMCHPIDHSSGIVSNYSHIKEVGLVNTKMTTLMENKRRKENMTWI